MTVSLQQRDNTAARFGHFSWYHDFHDCLNRGVDLGCLVERWETLANDLHTVHQEGCLDPLLANEAFGYASNAKCQSLAVISLAQYSERGISQLAKDLENLFVTHEVNSELPLSSSMLTEQIQATFPEGLRLMTEVEGQNVPVVQYL